MSTEEEGRRRRRHPLRALLVTLLVIVVVFHAAGGWYFSTRIHTDALAVTHPAAVRDLAVADVTRGRITLSDPGTPNTYLRASTTYGVAWPGGYGRVSGRPSVSGDDVTRSWTLVQGAEPPTGTRVSMDEFAYPLTPPPGARLVHYPGPRGSMPATYFPSTGHTWAILVHGKGATRAEMYRIAHDTTALHMPTLSIGYRNDADAPADPSHEYAFGVTEWHDLDAAVRWAKQQGASDIVLGGASMGGSIVASYLRHSRDADQVQSVVLDAPMLNFRDTIGWGAEQITLPTAGLPIPSTLTWTAEEVASLRYDVDWGATDYTSKLDWVRGPVLIIHGTVDDTVPISTSRLAAGRASEIRLVEFKGANHVESWNLDPTRYDRTVTDFLKTTVR